MSSILKALKKIEGRKVDTSLPAWPFGSGSLESIDRHIHRSRQRQKILGLLIILCVMALAGKLYIGSRSDSGNTASQNKTPTATAQPEKSAEEEAPEARKTFAVEHQSAPESKPGELSPETAPPLATVLSPSEEDSSETTAPQVISPPREELAETATEKETPRSTITENFGTPPADNAGLSLMALVWSRKPESRFVVINGSIVHEGGSIEESTVVRIEENYAVMRTGGVIWKLK